MLSCGEEGDILGKAEKSRTAEPSCDVPLTGAEQARAEKVTTLGQP